MYSLSEIEKNLNECYIKYNTLKSSICENNLKIESLDADLSEMNSNINLLLKSKPYIDIVIQKFSENIIKNLEGLLTYSVKKIFYDRDYSVSINVSEKRAQKCVDMFLVEDGKYYPISNSSISGGVLTVIGFILQVFFITNLNTDNIIFLDEQLSCISSQYVENFFSVVNELADKIGLSVVLVSHDDRFTKFASRIYRAKCGKFSLEEFNAR